MSPLRCVLAIFLALVLVSDVEPKRRAFADDDVHPLALVSASAAVCLEVPHFEATWSKFHGSRLMARLKEFPPVERFLGGAGFQKWTLVEDHVRRTTGKALSQHVLGAFADSLVVAVYLPEGKQPEGVVIAEARDAAALKSALQAWAALEPNQDSQTKSHQGQAYVRRAKSANSPEVVFYTVFGRTIALSDQEHLIQQIIEFRAIANQKTASAEGLRCLRDLPLYQTNRTRLPNDAATFLFVNTRRWDKVVNDGLRQSPDVAWIQAVLGGVSAIAASLRVEDEVVVDLIVDTSGSQLPPGWQKFVSGSNGGGDWNRRIPAHAILAISSRLDLGPAVQGWLSSASEAKSVEFARGRSAIRSVLLGRDLFTEILPLILRDWTVSLNSTDDAESAISPLDVAGQFSLAAWRLPDENSTPEKSLDHAFQFGLTFLGAMLSHHHGLTSVPVMVETESTADGIVRSLSGLKPWTLTYLLGPQRLVVATSRPALKASQVTEPGLFAKRLDAFSHRYFPAASQLAWVDAVQVRRVLAKRSDWIASQIAPDSTEGRQRVLKHLSRLDEVARVFDAAFVTARLAEDHVQVVFGVALDRSE